MKPDSLEILATPVDGVLGGQLLRLKDFIEKRGGGMPFARKSISSYSM
jgi:hypothetical protein